MWSEIHELLTDSVPKKDWLVFMLSDSKPNFDFELFVRNSIDKNILEFKAGGKKGELLHDMFDETMVEMEIEGKTFYPTITTCHPDETVSKHIS